MYCPRCGSGIDDPGARFCPICGASVALAAASAVAVPPGGAACPAHGGAAVGTCSRCGAFMCGACAQGGGGLCAACRERLGAAEFRLSRDRWSFGEVLDLAWERFKADGLMLSLSALIVHGVAMGVSFAGQMVQTMAMLALKEPDGTAGSKMAVVVIGAFLTVALQLLVQGVLQLGLARLCIESLHGRPVAIGGLFSQMRKVGKWVLQFVVAFLAIVLPLGVYAGLVAGALAATGGFEDTGRVAIAAVLASLVAIVPLLYWGIPFYFMQLELAANDEVGPVEAIRNSFTIARGNRLAIFGIGIVAVLISMAGVIVFCVGVVASMALGQLVLVGLYLALRNGSGLPPLRLARGE